MSDFFDTHSGNARPLNPRRKWVDRLVDHWLDLQIRLGGRLSAIRRQPGAERSRVLIVGVEVPSRSTDIHRVIERLRRHSRHDVTASIAPMGARGKFENIDEAIRGASQALSAYEWLVVTDDDIAFSPHLLDDLIDLATVANLSVSQPAHAIESHTTYAITKRKAASLVRLTSFVEIGPLTLLRNDAFEALVPFPESRWCYGIDVLWSEIASRSGFRMGIVDGTPIRHLRPVAGSYNMDAAIDEGRALLRRFAVTRNRAELFATDEVVVPTR